MLRLGRLCFYLVCLASVDITIKLKLYADHYMGAFHVDMLLKRSSKMGTQFVRPEAYNPDSGLYASGSAQS